MRPSTAIFALAGLSMAAAVPNPNPAAAPLAIRDAAPDASPALLMDRDLAERQVPAFVGVCVQAGLTVALGIVSAVASVLLNGGTVTVDVSPLEGCATAIQTEVFTDATQLLTFLLSVVGSFVTVNTAGG